MGSIKPPNIDKSTFFFWLILGVIFMYCLPLILITLEYIRNINLSTPIDPGQNKWFMAFALGHERSLNLVHKILMPLITFIAASSFATISSTRRTFVLSAIILLFIFMAIAMQVAFEAYVPDEASNVTPFFSRLEETLATYLMLILGLQFATGERLEGVINEQGKVIGKPSAHTAADTGVKK